MADVNVKINVDATQAAQSTEGLKQKMKQLKDQMGAILVETDGLTNATKEQREEYSRLQRQMANLTDIQGDMAARVKTLANDNMKLSATMQGASGLVAGFGAVQGAMALVGGESEDLVKILTKLQAAQALLNSLNQIATVTNKDSTLSVALRAVKENILTKSIKNQTKAQIALNVAKKAGIGIAVAAGAALVALAANYVKTADKAAKLNKELDHTASQSAAQNIAKVNELKASWDNLGGSLEKQQEFLEKNKSAIEGIGISLTNVNDAETFFSEQTEQYIQAQLARAKADAARAKITDLQSQIIDNEMAIERLENGNITTMEKVAVWAVGGAEEMKKLKQEQIAETQAQIDDLMAIILNSTQASEEAIKNLGSTAEETEKIVEQERESEMEELTLTERLALLRRQTHDEAVQQFNTTAANSKAVIDIHKIQTKSIVNDLKREEEAEKRIVKTQEEQIALRKKYFEESSKLVTDFSKLTSSLQDAELEKAGDNERKQLAIKKKYAKVNFLSQIASIGIDTAKGIMSAWSTAGQLGPIAGPIFGAMQSVFLGITGAAQIAKAKAEMNKALSGKAARGAFISGKSHALGGELWELEGGEAVLNKRAMAIPQYRALASYMNESTGGVSFMNGGKSVSALIDKSTIREIVSEVVSIPVVVSERSITDAQRKVQVINQRATY